MRRLGPSGVSITMVMALSVVTHRRRRTMPMQSQKYLVTIEDIAPQGPELSDEELRATRGGTYGPCSSTRGLDDWDSHPL
jgi:hypothetical protein